MQAEGHLQPTEKKGLLDLGIGERSPIGELLYKDLLVKLPEVA
jgi:hypothetical protein